MFENLGNDYMCQGPYVVISVSSGSSSDCQALCSLSADCAAMTFQAAESQGQSYCAHAPARPRPTPLPHQPLYPPLPPLLAGYFHFPDVSRCEEAEFGEAKADIQDICDRPDGLGPLSGFSCSFDSTSSCGSGSDTVYQAMSPTGYMCPGWYVEMYSLVPVSPEDCQAICSESDYCGATTFQEADQSAGRYDYCARGTARPLLSPDRPARPSCRPANPHCPATYPPAPSSQATCTTKSNQSARRMMTTSRTI